MAWTTTTTRSTGFLVTAAVWNSEHVDNMQHLEEVGYAQFTASVSPTATTEGTANSVVSLGAISYEAVPHLIEFYCYSARPDNGGAGRTLSIILQDSTTTIGIWGVLATPAASTSNSSVHLQHRFTPTAASHTYNVKAFVSVGTGFVGAGAGGPGNNMPGFIRVTRIPV